MKIGYPCINNQINCTHSSTFRLINYSKENMINKITQNIECLKKVLDFNHKHNIQFFRISSKIIPFASHPVCTFNWQKYFKKEFQEIGQYMKEKRFRISMHPDQFVIINAENHDIVRKSIEELKYHCELLNLMRLNSTAKVQIHIGGVYKNKEESMKRFEKNYKKLPKEVKKRLVIENDEKSYSLKDCLIIHKNTGIPVLLDTFHHKCLNNKETIRTALILANKTWKKKDGKLMVDYSSQKPDSRRGSHTESINVEHFKNFIKLSQKINFDVMLEIKDKEESALKAVKILRASRDLNPG